MDLENDGRVSTATRWQGGHMRVALIKPPATYANWYKRPAIGACYISSYLAAHGFESRIFDAYFQSWSQQELLKEVLAYRPAVIGLTAMTHEIDEAASLAGVLKRQLGTPTIIGGAHIAALPARTIEQYASFDFGVYGEGEKTALELVESLGSSRDLARMPGLVSRVNCDVTVGEPRPPLTDQELSELPFPNLQDYYGCDRGALKAGKMEYTIMATRGCPYHCVFCMQVLGRKVRRRSPESVIAEIEWAVERYGAHTVNFVDEIFLMDHANTRNILRLMIDRGLPGRVRWSGCTRANLVRPELIRLAKAAGCYRLGIGVESGDDQVLRNLQKGITVDQVRHAIRVIKDNGIQTQAYYIVGNPGETPETIRKTISLAAELNTDHIAVGAMVPYPGTEVHRMAQAGEHGYRLVSEHWADYDKYGGRALEVAGLPPEVLAAFQRRALILFYVKNLRLLDLLRYVWGKRNALMFFSMRWLCRRVEAVVRRNPVQSTDRKGIGPM